MALPPAAAGPPEPVRPDRNPLLAMRQRQGEGSHNQMGRVWSFEMEQKNKHKLHSHKLEEVHSRLLPIEMDMPGGEGGN